MEGKDIITREQKLMKELGVAVLIWNKHAHKTEEKRHVFSEGWSADEMYCKYCSRLLAIQYFKGNKIVAQRLDYGRTYAQKYCPQVSKLWDPRTWDWRWMHRWD